MSNDPILDDIVANSGGLFSEDVQVDFNEIEYKGFWRHTTLVLVNQKERGTWPSGDLRPFEVQIQYGLAAKEGDKPLKFSHFHALPVTPEQNGDVEKNQ